MFVYLENVKNPTVRFEVVAYDKETKTAKLKGEYGAEFSRDVSKESLAKFGYKLVKSETKLPLNSVPLPPTAKKKAEPIEEDEEEAPPPPTKKKKSQPQPEEEE